jgi:hypothetical protein
VIAEQAPRKTICIARPGLQTRLAGRRDIEQFTQLIRGLVAQDPPVAKSRIRSCEGPDLSSRTSVEPNSSRPLGHASPVSPRLPDPFLRACPSAFAPGARNSCSEEHVPVQAGVAY